MKIDRPEPRPRTEGAYPVYVNGVAYGKPYAKIYLDEDKQLSLNDINLDDALRLAAASAQVAAELTAAHARMTAPHGSDHFYQGTCQLCGKPEADELHAEPEPLKVSDSTIEQAKLVADDIEAGTWPPKAEPAAARGDRDAQATALVGRLVEDAHDDSDCPTVGLVVGQADEDTLEVLWGERRFEEPRRQGSYEPFDSLRPARGDRDEDGALEDAAALDEDEADDPFARSVTA